MNKTTTNDYGDLQILGAAIAPGTGQTVNFNMANLYTSTKVTIPVIVERAAKPGPTVLITAGIHGDEVNGVEIVRQIIAKGINKPLCGTTICIPILNVFGFLSMQRYFPDGKDLNRVFPGTKMGSLASRFAYQFTSEILIHADLCMDFHAGGSGRFNAAQIRIRPEDYELKHLADIFNAPFTLISKNIERSYRSICAKKQIKTLLFEGGKSQDNNKEIAKQGVVGIMRILKFYNMLDAAFEIPQEQPPTVYIQKSSWIRAKYSGLLHIKIPIGKKVEKGEILATITDPYGQMRHTVKSPLAGYIINVNEFPLVYQGDAIFHIGNL